VDPALAARAAELLAALGWFGLVELQLVEPDHGPRLLLELNGRFYGSMALALAAGVNFPDAWARLGTGGPAPPLQTPRPGVRYQWLEGDLRAAWAEPRGGRLRDVLGCLAYAPGAAHSIWRSSDPGPGLWVTADLARRAVRRLSTRRAPS
jgi:predicted ATP-grasp superfamily ATP-dependent carboligase